MGGEHDGINSVAMVLDVAVYDFISVSVYWPNEGRETYLTIDVENGNSLPFSILGEQGGLEAEDVNGSFLGRRRIYIYCLQETVHVCVTVSEGQGAQAVPYSCGGCSCRFQTYFCTKKNLIG